METLIEKAKTYAEQAHTGQTRKYTGEPYFAHLERVANKTAYYSGKPEVVAAAYLYNVLNECENITLKDLYNEFGWEVSNLVLELTDTSKNFPKLKRGAKKAIDRTRLAEASAEGQLIKVLACLDNLKDIRRA